MQDNTKNNKRLAKNSLFLYLRQLFTLGISLYTSRVVLNVLGVEDFGIYNVVGGIVAMLGFLSASLGSSASRFISFNIGKGNQNTMKQTFSTILFIHLLLAFLILIFSETIGLWFLQNKLTIPFERVTAAFWVYQFSILSAMFAIIYVPYSATVISHERMDVYAWISVLNAVIQLIFIYTLKFIEYDKLIAYSLILTSVHFINQIWYIIYCFTHFQETRVKPKYYKSISKEILSFTGWSIWGNLASIANSHGLNILLNLFFGPTVNAARGIASQVQTAVRYFVINFQVAVNPQITKSFASGELSRLHQLILLSSKFSFFLMILIILPLMLEAELVLFWWLEVVPDYTVSFLRLILCSTLVYTLSNPLTVSVYASGNLKKYQICDSLIMLTVLPFSFFLLKYYTLSPEVVFLIYFLTELFAHFIRMKIVLPIVKLSLRNYFNAVLYPILKVIFIIPLPPLLLYLYLPANFFTFLLVCSVSTCTCLVVLYKLAITSEEKSYIIHIVKSFFKKKI